MRLRVSFKVPKSLSSGPEPLRSEVSRLFEEAFRTLRSTLLLRVREGDKTFLVTSARPGEGKSTVVVNLARMLAAGNRNVLLVDADLRRPRLHKIFGIDDPRGLTEVLTGAVAPKVVYHRVENGLTVLTSGRLPSDPQELLLGKNLESVVSLIKNDFDMVLFDSAPVLAFADTTLLAPRMDGVIVVLKSGEVTTSEAILVRDRLRSVHAKLAGCVLTCVPNLYLQPYHPYTRTYFEQSEASSASSFASSIHRFSPPREAKS